MKSKCFTKVTQFLNAPFGADQIKRAIAFSSMKTLKKLEKKQKFNEVSKVSKGKKFFRHGKSDRWRELLSQEQINAVVEVNEPLMQKLGYFDKAVEHYKKALAVKPDFSNAFNNLGIVYHELGHYDNSLKSFQKA